MLRLLVLVLSVSTGCAGQPDGSIAHMVDLPALSAFNRMENLELVLKGVHIPPSHSAIIKVYAEIKAPESKGKALRKYLGYFTILATSPRPVAERKKDFSLEVTEELAGVVRNSTARQITVHLVPHDRRDRPIDVHLKVDSVRLVVSR
jgi:hypothetical protein